MKEKIKLAFTDFWSDFDINNNLFIDVLNDEFDVILTKDNPDYLLFSLFGTDYLNFDCTRILFIGENVRPDFRICDYCFTFDYTNDPRNYRLPLYSLFDDVYKLTKPKNMDELMSQKTSFCNFIHSNPGPKKRFEFYKKLSKYKRVDSGGRFHNNIGGRVIDKIEFIRRYKFTFAFESISYPGYTTEKIFEPMLVGSIPIYWGNELIHRDFNTKSFLNWHDYNNDEALIEKIIELDCNDELYKEYLSQPFFENNQVNEFVNRENILNRFKYIFSQNITPVSKKSKIITGNYFERKSDLNYQKIKFHIKRYWDKVVNFKLIKFKIKFNRMRGK